MTPATESALLHVRDLRVSFHRDGLPSTPALRGVSFELREGEVIGLLGESGCGKTTLGLSLLGVLPPSAQVENGSVEFRGRNLLALQEPELKRIRGAEISMVFQEPGVSLNPVMRVGEQIADAVHIHRRWPRRRCCEEALTALARTRLEDASRIYASYPHELSGGQRQRVLIALALACRPAVVIADEPTASLDTMTQAEIVELFRELKKGPGLSLLWITHNPALLARIADRILVMYAGRIAESGPLPRIFSEPLHPYTRALLESRPRTQFQANRRKARLPVIPAEPQDPASLPCGCAFAPRCSERMQVCTSREPNEIQPDSARKVCCFKYGG